jgi:GH25 family lysozyme M1 (1,4-beta-N-acetylmuramidase)
MNLMKKQLATAMVCTAALGGLLVWNSQSAQAAEVKPASSAVQTQTTQTDQTSQTDANAQTQAVNTNTDVSAQTTSVASTNNTASAQAASYSVKPEEQHVQVLAQSNQVAARSYGVDVSSYQGTDMSSYARNGARYVIVKTSEGTSYRNPKASAQIASAKANDMMVMAYHFATFGSNASTAVSEANYAVSAAKSMGLPSGSYLACDWETGDGNYVNGSRDANTTAVLAFMRQVRNAGYLPLIYSGAYLLRNNLNTATINASFPISLWVASYATSGRIDTPNFDYFPSMDGVAIWQFTDNWGGLYVDGNISLVALDSVASTINPHNQTSNTSKPTNNGGKRVNSGSPIATVSFTSPIAVWTAPQGKTTGKYLANGSRWKVTAKSEVNGNWWYNLGGNQWVDGRYVMVTGFSSIPENKSDDSGSSSHNGDNLTTGETNYRAVGKINYIPGYGVNLWYGYGNSAKFSGRRLQHGSSWKIFKRAVLDSGKIWYNLGGNQWIDGNYVVISQ